MKLRFQTWFRFCLVISLIVVPLMFWSFFASDGKYWDFFLFCALLPVGLTGGFVALAIRAGWIEMVYSDKDRRGLSYRLAETVAEHEFATGMPFSKKYFESFGLGGKSGNMKRDGGREGS